MDDHISYTVLEHMEALRVDPRVDPDARRLLEHGGLPLDPRFQGKPAEVNATLDAWVVAA